MMKKIFKRIKKMFKKEKAIIIQFPVKYRCPDFEPAKEKRENM